MHVDVRARQPEGAVVFERNPAAVRDAKRITSTEAVMGDIVQLDADAIDVCVEVVAHAGIERVELRNGEKLIETIRLISENDLDRRLRVFRLPDDSLDRELSVTRTVRLDQAGDNPVWVCVTTEDGHQAWSSPMYLFR